MRTAVCIATGASLTKEDAEYCEGKAKVYAVKEAHRLAPFADVLYSGDYDWYEYHNGVPEFKGERWMCGEREPGRPFVEGFSRFNTEMETCKRLMPGYMTPDGVMTLWFGWRYLKESATFQYAGGFVPQSFDEGENALGGSFDGDGRDFDDD